MTPPALDLPASAAVSRLDLFGDGFIREPFPCLDALRTDAPVHQDPGTPLWLVSRYDDIRRVLLDPAAFRPDNAQAAVTPLPVGVLRVLARAGFRLPPSLANIGADSHHGLRRVVTRFFNAQRVAAAVPVIERPPNSSTPLSGASTRQAPVTCSRPMPRSFPAGC
ncbi:hypothetical protein [Streptomyces sp. NPDC047974]|uniref:hypothetical protein n=1 Tax=Streptomyces sp. NPDC047974 TaxID=3154343 RepID=UPI0033F6A386